MKSMVKKFFILLAIVLLVSSVTLLSACNNDGGDLSISTDKEGTSGSLQNKDPEQPKDTSPNNNGGENNEDNNNDNNGGDQDNNDNSSENNDTAEIFVIQDTVLKGLTDYGKTLTLINIPEGITEIGENAFYECVNLREITIPEGVLKIGNSAFENCKNLAFIDIPDSVETIGRDAFSYTGLIKVTLGAGIKSINGQGTSSAFGGCEKLVEVYNKSSYNLLTNSIDVLKDAKNIYTLESGESKLTVTDDKFVFYIDENDISLIGYYGIDKALELPDGLNGKEYVVGDSAFSKADIESVIVPSSVTKIGGYAFNECTYLNTIILPDTPILIDTDAFYESAYYENTENWDNAILYIGKHLIKADSKNIPEEVTVKDGTLTVGKYAFSGCKTLKKVTIPDSVLRIVEKAFSNCEALVTVELPDSIIYMDYSAFVGTALYKDKNNRDKENSMLGMRGMLYIGKYLIEGECLSHSSYYKSFEYEVKDGTIFIVDYAFGPSSHFLKEIYIPKSVKILGVGSLYSSDELETVVYEGTKAEWEAIDDRGCFGAFAGESVTIKCSDGDIIYTPGK